MNHRCMAAVLPFVVLATLPTRATATLRDSVPPDTTVVLIVRHAERASDAPNSDLSAAGRARADAIAAIARQMGVSAVYATDFCRAAQTAQPAALGLGAPLRVTATGNGAGGLDGCAPEIVARRDVVAEPSPDGIARRVLEEQSGRVVLIVGHSNTVPAIATALGARVCPELIATDANGRCWLTEDRYDDLFVVRVPGDGGATQAELRTQELSARSTSP